MKKICVFIILFILSCSINTNFIVAQRLSNEVQFTAYEKIAGYKGKKRKNPSFFQGNKKKKQYFEGWYFKMVSDKGESIMSIIPGISLSDDGSKQHAFIQLIDGKTAETYYYSYPIDSFYFSKDEFAVRIGENYFSEDEIKLNIQNDSTSIIGQIQMSNQVYLSPKKDKAIMGWYRFVPFMECYHGVVSLNHDLKGSLTRDGELYNFENGIGYIEKDWGRSMPSDWIWIQTNSFQTPNTSFMLSVANIPWLGSSFTGFLGFYMHNGEAKRFGTYTKAKIDIDASNPDALKITIKDKENTYLIQTKRSKSGLLKAPVKGAMDRRIAESIDAHLQLQVLDKSGNIIFEDRTEIAGLETVGSLEDLSGQKSKK